MPTRQRAATDLTWSDGTLAGLLAAAACPSWRPWPSPAPGRSVAGQRAAGLGVPLAEAEGGDAGG
jgi:hypothetical protein